MYQAASSLNTWKGLGIHLDSFLSLYLWQLSTALRHQRTGYWLAADDSIDDGLSVVYIAECWRGLEARARSSQPTLALTGGTLLLSCQAGALFVITQQIQCSRT